MQALPILSAYRRSGTAVANFTSVSLACFIVAVIFTCVRCSCCCCFWLYARLSHLCNELMYKD